eukprot:TRINITY_DN26535_c0_g1_i1.p1 TRINITY_DN26535_c0_g1~~TRINITY_DN26535_c0_g1_i1.p1  ORF type:complete len:344 (-),score=58.66 TRINITY_DN26535_c0_g1_i1:19-1050(-)
MVKTVEIRETIPVDLESFWELFLEDSAFQKQYHTFVGNQGVDIIDWIASPGKKEKQRICFFTMVENEGKSELENTKCTETQTCVYATGERELELRCNIRPEKLGAAIFVIDSVWRVSATELPNGQPGSRVHITVKVECTKKIWGVTGMIENVLEQQTQHAHARWMELARRRAEEHLAAELAAQSAQAAPPASSDGGESSMEYSEPEVYRAGGGPRSVRSSRVHASQASMLSPRRPPRVRLRLATLKRVVTGTEKIAHMFSSAPFSSLRQSSSSEHLDLLKGLASSSSAETLTDVSVHDASHSAHDHVDSDLEVCRCPTALHSCRLSVQRVRAPASDCRVLPLP